MMRLKVILPVALVVSVGVGFTLAPSRSIRDVPAEPGHRSETSSEQNTDLQAVAATALGTREGSIVVIDPQTGHIRAVVNPEIAFKTAFPPGSTIKPFTTIAALRAGVLTTDTRIRCRGKYKREDVIDACVHRPQLPPFNPAEAVAYSCNYYFATTGERLDGENFAQLLTEFGFGQTTGIEDQQETAGIVARTRWQAQSALGEGPFLQVTLVQMAMAYAALFNGGTLLKPNYDGIRKVRAQVRIENEERATLLEGMRGAVSFGTAEKADLDSLPVHIIGKTGTSTQLQGFRTQGWFAGIAFKPNTAPEPANAQLLVVVYLKNAHGSDAAELARPIFEEFARKREAHMDTTYVSVHQVSENVTQRMPLEDYVLHVVSSEASVEDQPDALKALAIAARTYALKNLGRHKEHGYDFAATRRNIVELQPLKLLKQRQILETTLRHELVHVLIEAIGGGKTPRWLTEGMAVYVAGEGRLIESRQEMSSMSPLDVDHALASPKSSADMRNAYAAAYNLVKQLIRSEGENKVWKRIADRSYSVYASKAQKRTNELLCSLVLKNNQRLDSHESNHPTGSSDFTASHNRHDYG